MYLISLRHSFVIHLTGANVLQVSWLHQCHLSFKHFLCRFFPWLMFIPDSVSTKPILRFCQIRLLICSVTSTHVTVDGHPESKSSTFVGPLWIFPPTRKLSCSAYSYCHSALTHFCKFYYFSHSLTTIIVLHIVVILLWSTLWMEWPR